MSLRRELPALLRVLLSPKLPEDRRAHMGVAAGLSLLLALYALLMFWSLYMRKIVSLAAVVAAGIALSGCLSTTLVKDMTAEQKGHLVDTFIQNCSGTVQFGARGATGQMGGSASAEVNLNGACGQLQGKSTAQAAPAAGGAPAPATPTAVRAPVGDPPL